MNYYRRHIGDYIRDTAHLSLLEHGVYSRLLDVYYSRENGIPKDQAARLIGARSPDELQAVEAVLSEFFQLTDGVWRQSRCDEEIELSHAKANQNRSNGKKGGRPSRDETEPDTEAEPRRNPVGFQEETQSVSDHNPNGSQTEPIPSSHKPIAISHPPSQSSGGKRRAAPRTRTVPDGFVLTPDLRAWSEQENSLLDVDREFAKFRDHEFREPRGDWLRTWKRWVREGCRRGDFAKKGGGMVFAGQPVEWQ